jgi:hypothetical protein
MLRTGGVLCDLYKTAAPYHHGVAGRLSAEVRDRISNNLSLHQLLCSAVPLFVSTPIFALLFSCLSPFVPSAVTSFSSILTFALLLFPYIFPFEPSLCRFLVFFHSIPAFAWLFSCFFPFKPRSGVFLFVSILTFALVFSCLFPF